MDNISIVSERQSEEPKKAMMNLLAEIPVLPFKEQLFRVYDRNADRLQQTC